MARDLGLLPRVISEKPCRHGRHNDKQDDAQNAHGNLLCSGLLGHGYFAFAGGLRGLILPNALSSVAVALTPTSAAMSLNRWSWSAVLAGFCFAFAIVGV